jgi:hypothetical protein
MLDRWLAALARFWQRVKTVVVGAFAGVVVGVILGSGAYAWQTGAFDRWLVAIVMVAACVSLWGVVCAVNAMFWRHTKPTIAFGFWLAAVGWGAEILVGVAYLVHVPPVIWIGVLFFGLACLAIGNAAIFLGNRRQCCCPSCPVRRTQFEGGERHGYHA